MENALSALITDNLSFAIATGLIALMHCALKILKGAFDFHYDYFTRRHLRRVTDLLPLVDPDDQEHHFLKQSINCEVFKISSGVKTTNRSASALMHLCKYNRISPNQVKLFARHINSSPDGQIFLTINLWDKVAAGYSVFATCIILFYGIYALVSSLFIKLSYGWVIGATMFVFCIFVLRYFLLDIRNFQEVKRVRNELLANPLPPCSESRPILISTGVRDTPVPERVCIHPLADPAHTGVAVDHSKIQTHQSTADCPAIADPPSV